VSKLRVNAFTVSADRFGAGPDQSREQPLGRGGEECTSGSCQLELEGGTVFHFVTEGIEAALNQARAAAKGKDVRIGGGAATIRQYLQARLLDEMHVAMSPILLGRGESLFEGIDFPALGYKVKEHVATEAAMHLVVGR
jgi:dihydrofolate reductase